MSVLRFRIVLLAFLLLLFGLVIGLASVQANIQSGLDAYATHPIVVSGASFGAFAGEDETTLRLYAYDAALDEWNPIPYQFDERDVNGDLVASEDGLLDGNDELVFMARDAGDAAAGSWPSDVSAETIRFPIRVSAVGADGYVYVYRSPSLPDNSTQYIFYDNAIRQVDSVSYTVRFEDSDFWGVADLKLNGSFIDVLDRMKQRLCYSNICNPQFDEDSLQFVMPSLEMKVAGPIRAGIDSGNQHVMVYDQYFDFNVDLPLNIVPPLLTLNQFATTFDFADPTVSGLTNFYNSNGDSAIIDGVNDLIPSQDPQDWFQVSGAAGGLVIMTNDLVVEGEFVLQKMYYRDEAELDTDDTGDQRAFGESGFVFNLPERSLVVPLRVYTLPENSTTNVGADYYNAAQTELTTIVSTEFFTVAGQAYLPILSTAPPVLP